MKFRYGEIFACYILVFIYLSLESQGNKNTTSTAYYRRSQPKVRRLEKEKSSFYVELLSPKISLKERLESKTRYLGQKRRRKDSRKMQALLQNSTNVTSLMIIMKGPAFVDIIAETNTNNAVDVEKEKAKINQKQKNLMDALAENQNFQKIKVIGKVQHIRNAIFVDVPLDNFTWYSKEISNEMKKYVKKIIHVGNYYTSSNFEKSPMYTPAIFQNSKEVLNYIGASSLHENGFLGRNIIIAIIDSGIDYTHANFGGNGTVEAYDKAAGNVFDPTNTKGSTRDGYFPTSKVIEGYDFVGDSWPIGEINPDDDPIDFESHGSHTADIAAGLINGIAPEANLLAIKSCSSVSSNICSGAALVQGIEYAILQKADIINFSIGMSYGQPFDDEVSFIVERASRLGVLTVASSGNTGDRPYSVGVPSSTGSALSVAETDIPIYFQVIIVNDFEYEVRLYPDALDPPRAIRAIIQYGDGKFQNTDACNPYEPDQLLNKIIVVDGFGCAMAQKIDNVAAAGASMILINGDFRVVLSEPYNINSLQISPIPAYFIGINDAFTIIAQVIEIDEDTFAIFDPAFKKTNAGKTTALSARGPDMSYNSIKPEIGAPGAISSAQAGSGDKESLFRGTSGSSPVIAGAAALLKQVCFSISSPRSTSLCSSPLMLKSWLMNYASINIVSDTTNERAEISRIGAGELNLYPMQNVNFWAYNLDSNQASISIGLIDAYKDLSIKKTIRINNMWQKNEQNLRISSIFRVDRKINKAMNILIRQRRNVLSLSRDLFVVVPECNFIDIEIEFEILSEFVPENHMSSGANGIDPTSLTNNEIDGYIVISQVNKSPKETKLFGYAREISLPFHALVRKASRVEVMKNGKQTDEPVLSSEFFFLEKKINIMNHGVGKAQIDIFNIVALSSEEKPGKLGEMQPTPDMKAIGYRTMMNSECAFGYSIDFAISSWRRQRHLIAIRYILYLIVYGTYDVGENTTSTSVFNSGPIYDSTDVSQRVYVDDVNFGINSNFFAFHSTNTKNTVMRICGEQIGLPFEMVQYGNFSIEVRSAIARDELSDGKGDFVEFFSIVPFGERYKVKEKKFSGKAEEEENEIDLNEVDLIDSSSNQTINITEPDLVSEKDAVTTDGPLTLSSFDLDFEQSVELDIEETKLTSKQKDDMKGVMLFTNSDRGEGKRGASTEGTEMMLFLDRDVITTTTTNPFIKYGKMKKVKYYSLLSKEKQSLQICREKPMNELDVIYQDYTEKLYSYNYRHKL